MNVGSHAGPAAAGRLAAAGIMIVTASATVYHVARGEMRSAAITLVLFGIATFVAYMRYRVLPIPAARRTL